MNIKLEKPIVFFDLETTGTSIKKDRIIEIYAKKLFPDGSYDEYYQVLNPEVEISKEASDIHGYTNDDVKDNPTMKEKAGEIYEFFKGCDLGGYNCVKFDIPFLMEELSRNGFKYFPIKANIIDPFKIIQKKESYRLGDVYKRYFGEDFEGAHSAKSDIEATIRVFEEQMKRYDLGDSVTEVSDLVRSDNSGNRFIDFNGFFYKSDNKYYYGMGKNKDKEVSTDLNYLEWVVEKSSLANNVKMVGSVLLEHYNKETA